MYCQAPSEAGTVAHESTEKIRNANRHINLRTNVVPQQDPLLHLRDIFRVRQIYLYGRYFIGGFYAASEIFLTPRKTTV